MRERLPRIGTLVLLILALAFAAGCGDDDSGGDSVDGDTDPQTILDRSLGAGESIESGVLDLEFNLESPAAQGGTVSASLQGPFQSSAEEGQLPQLDFDAVAAVDAAGTDFDFDGGLTLTSEGAYISSAGEAYQLDAGTFALLQSSYERSSQLEAEQEEQATSLSQFGIDPSTWVTDLTNEGTEDLDGTEVVHVSGTADLTAIASDLQTVAEQTGQAGEVDAEALAQLDDSVETATIDVYASPDDSTLRQFDLDVALSDPTGGSESTTVSLSVGIAEPGEEQEITPPEDPKPVQELLEQFPDSAQALGGLDGLGAGAEPPPADAGATGGAASTEAADAYFECAAAAETPEAVDACAPLLDG